MAQAEETCFEPVKKKLSLKLEKYTRLPFLYPIAEPLLSLGKIHHMFC
jgi:hypothetical protein